ncbi:MAG: rRNA maturation RNase YbeY [bacterium]|nr:rRNA maturation RNase YbeY [bacterium]
MIEINNLTTNIVDEKFLEKTTNIVLKGEKATRTKFSSPATRADRRRVEKSGCSSTRPVKEDCVLFSTFASLGGSVRDSVKEKAGLSIALVGQGRIRELNKKYRNKNRATDVLAFPESKVGYPPSGWEKFKVAHPSLRSGQGLGEIVICLREVRKNAKKFGLTYNKELAKVLIHGTLHLFGYDHERSEKEEKIMKKKEECYLSQV